MEVRRHYLAALLALLAIAGVLAVATRVLVARFDAIELDQAIDKAVQAQRALEADLNQLAVSTRDYAEWDDAQTYIVDRDAEFIRANFSFASLDGMQVDRMAIVDRNGAVIYGARIDRKQGKVVENIPRPLTIVIPKLRSQIAALRALPSVERILRTEDGLLAFSMIEIARSDHSLPTGAALFFGRFIEDDELARVQQTSRLPAEFVELAADAGPKPRAVVTDDAITGVALIHDWQGTPLVEIQVTGDRAIGALGRRTTMLLMGTIGLLALACCGLFLFMMRRQQRHWQWQMTLQKRHESILSGLEECIALLDPITGRVLEANSSLLRTLDYTRDDLPHLSLEHLFVDVDLMLLASNDVESSGLRDCRLRARDGRLIECEINITHLSDHDMPLVCIAARDMTQRRLAEQKLKENQSLLTHLSEHDALTGLPNRQYLQVRLPDLLHRISVEERTLALLYLDLDHFKNINDSKGHGRGDAILNVVAERLRRDASESDVVLRMGGDEFVVVAPLAAGAAMKDRAQRLLALLQEPIVYDGETIALSASVGGALYPQDGLDAEALLKHADIALYQAKSHGRNCFQPWVSDMDVKLSEHVVLEQALRRAIGTEQIHIAYQPVVDLQTGLLVSFEALARWQHPDMGNVPPGSFIPVAERSGLIVDLGQQIVHDVIRQLREWQDAGLTLAPVAINVAPIQLERTEFATLVHETALKYEIDPQLVAFEVTESALLQNSNKHVVMIDSLRYAGSRVYIDDFGTGFSNLSYLKTLPVDAVKIDQSFVRSIETDASDVAIVSSIISMAKQLRLDTIAEGIETAAHAEKLRQLGCMYGQGYYFSKPMPAAQCRALLEQLGAARKLTETVKIRAFKSA